MLKPLCQGKLAMRKYLVFLLCSPMASFGDYAGHERRGSGLVPLRSAVLGLIGAAIGVKRSDSNGQDQLRSYSVAVQSFQQSTPLRDYHTVQTVPTAKAKRPDSRRYALEKAGLGINTTITIRDYRCDVMVGVALWGDDAWDLEDIERHLRCPTYPLYLGRKSCPLTSPLSPFVCVERGPVEALEKIEIPEWQQSRKIQIEDRNRFTIYSDPVGGYNKPQIIERVPGEPLDRSTWTFEECDIWHLDPPQLGPEGEGGEA